MALILISTIVDAPVSTTFTSVLGNSSRKIIVPAYFYPSLWNTGSMEYYYWAKLFDVANRLGPQLIVIVNPFNGPGDMVDPYYSKVIEELIARRAIVLGYVYTKWAQRPIEEVLGDVDTWFTLYPGVAGIFVDEVSPEGSETVVNYYQAVTSKVKSRNGLVVCNPGTPVRNPASYNEVCDMVIVFEDGLTEYMRNRDIVREAIKSVKNPGVILEGVLEDPDSALSILEEDGVKVVYVYHKFYSYNELSIHIDSLVKWVAQPSSNNAEKTSALLASPYLLMGITVALSLFLALILRSVDEARTPRSTGKVLVNLSHRLRV